MRTILVTGAAGFIGSHLCEALLAQDFQVIGIDNFDAFYDRTVKENNLKEILQHPNFTFLEGDAGKVSFLNTITNTPDVVVHLAAKAGVLPSLKDPQAYIQENIGLTNVILEWMRSRGIQKMVFASSSSVYGNNAKIPFDEADVADFPISPYAFTKRSCELMNYTYHTLYGFDIVNLRFFTVYGERQRPDLAIHKFLKLLYEGRPITIYGDGNTARDYTYYKDTVAGIISAIAYVNNNKSVFDTFNLGNHTPVSLKELIETIADLAQIRPVLVHESMKPGDVDITYASIEKAKTILGYNPQTSLKQGLANFIVWYEQKRLQPELK